MNIRGDDQDYRNVMDFIHRLASADDALRKRLDVFVGPDYDAAVDESRRKAWSQMIYPYHGWAKQVLASREGAAKHGEETETSTLQENTISLTPPLALTATDSKQVPIIASEEPTSSTPLSIILALFVVVCALLWLLVKKRK
jgi:hypothetical protein